MSDNLPQAMVAISTASPPRVCTADFDDHESGTPRAIDPLLIGAECSRSRKPRGRPPGSKNKPKPPVIITQECDSAMFPAVFEVAAGTDVAAALADFAQRRGVCLSILGGSGDVSNVVLSVHSTSTVALSGRFDILSLTGTFILPQPAKAGGVTPSRPITDLTLSLSGPQGQVIGGIVVGPLAAAGPVTVVAATFASPEYHQLPLSKEATPEATPADLEGKGGFGRPAQSLAGDDVVDPCPRW